MTLNVLLGLMLNTNTVNNVYNNRYMYILKKINLQLHKKSYLLKTLIENKPHI